MFIHALTVLTRTTAARRVLPAVLAGRIVTACAVVEGILESDVGADRGADAAELAIVCADLMLAQDRDEQAESMYRRAVRAATTSTRGQVRLVAARNTGFLGLYQRRFGTASACFKRVSEDALATAAQQVEALGGFATARHALGHTREAMAALDMAERIVLKHGTDGQADGMAGAAADQLSTFISLVRAGLLVQAQVRSHAALDDHAYWRAAEALEAGARSSADVIAVISACRLTHGGSILVQRILDHLGTLVAVTQKDPAALRSLNEQLLWWGQARLTSAERQCRIETALVALTARNVEVAQHVLEPLRTSDGRAHRQSFEVSYCLAKICELTGRSGDSMAHYRRYTLESVQCLRRESQALPSAHRLESTAGTLKDDVEMSLPAKYRRAYRYLLDHLYSPVLSVREIAEHIGVTMRALQTAFRSHLGVTPMELVQRCRVERIRNDLLHGDFTGSTVIDIATRWGISNRSTLLACYRKHFSETPADTLARRDAGREEARGHPARPLSMAMSQ